MSFASRMGAMSMTLSLLPVRIDAGALCTVCTPAGMQVLGGDGGPFAIALSQAIEVDGGKSTAYSGLPFSVVSETGAAVATATAEQGKAGWPDTATAAASAQGELRGGETTAWTTVLWVGALPQPAAQAAAPDSAASIPAWTATRPVAAGMAAAQHPASVGSAPADGPATLAASRQILPDSGAEPDAVMDLAAGEGRLRLPAGPELTRPTLAVGDPFSHGLVHSEANAAAHFDRVQDMTRSGFEREMLVLSQPLRTSGWDTELAQRVIWMAGRQAQSAEITVNPPNLGSIEVHLSLRDNIASVYFYSPHAAVREAIDESLGRLRDMLAAAGIQLHQAQVGRESLTERQASGYLTATRALSAARLSEDEGLVNVRQGLIDLYV